MGESAGIGEIEQRLREIDLERNRLVKELGELRTSQRSTHQGLALDARSYPNTPEEKVALFESLFVARRDIFPRYWESADGLRKGYSPVHEPVWESGRRLKPSEILKRYGVRKFTPLSSAVVESHLRGSTVAGTYAIRPDDTCIFLAADFDGGGWREDAGAYRNEATRLGIDCLVEISRSGNGAHTWILFAEAVKALLARRLGSLLLARAAARHPNIRLDTYDRFFPNQDMVPKGGFGNLIALPLQKERRAHGFTEFVDEEFAPYPDQWEILAKIRRLTLEDVAAILEEEIGTSAPSDTTALDFEEAIVDASSNDALELPPVPDWKAWLNESLVVPKKDLPDATIARLRSLATFPNPVFFEKQRQRFPTYNIPRYLFSGEIHPDRIVLPRGCLEEVIELFAECGSRLEIEDRRLRPKRIRISFSGDLHSRQKAALQDLLQHDHGVLVAPPGSGKTVIACAAMAKRKVPTLILVNRQTLLEQWVDRLAQFLGNSRKEIGQLRGTRKKPTGRIDVAMMQTIANLENPKAFFRDYGYVIIDECHHVPAVTLEAVLKQCGSRFITGLTATPERKDRLERLLIHQCGPIRHVLGSEDDLPMTRRVFLQTTSFSACSEDGRALPLHLTWQRMISDPQRNQLIASDIVDAIHSHRIPIVLSDRREHIETLRALVDFEFSKAPSCLMTLDGSLSQKERDARLNAFAAAVDKRDPACIFATSSLLGEGFDLPILDTLVLAMPISFKGRVIQYAGRLHRESPGKDDIAIYDYLDEQLPVCLSMYRRRSPAYRTMRYEIILSSADTNPQEILHER